MPADKQFGTLRGVFIPSLLSIVGAIMFLRLGWIVGEGGLTASISIAVVSFLISITAGLGLSAIATDKKLKKDGIYYMLSRSLGVPMGATISIALVIALLFTVALQIAGLTESMLHVPQIADMLGIEPCAKSYRIIGSIILAILLVSILTTDSATVLSLRAFASIAIIIAIVFITIGIINTPEIRNTAHLQDLSNIETPSWIYLFAIFFPASTGFTIGLTFHKSLVDPKKSIPKGMTSAMFASFVFYVLAMIGLYFGVDSQHLTGNYTNFFPNTSILPTVTFACMWISFIYIAYCTMATLPKIVFSMAHDKVLPRWFSTVAGKNDKPIVAIITLFILAECTVLVGDFNRTALISTMFLLATYTLINLAFLLEKWTNSDLKATLNTNKYVGLAGAIVCMIMMYQINKIGTIAIFVFDIIIYFIIRHKNLRMEYGDVWQNVLLSITKTSLMRINKKRLNNKAWQPNVIVFSGEKNKRPYLNDFGRWIIGKHGFLSVFNVTTALKGKFFTHKNENTIIGNSGNQWIETKLFPCEDIFAGIETVAGTYGFTGIEPNTIIIGFNGTTTNQERYMMMINNIIKLDKNLLLIHFDHNNGYGNKKIVDIWITPDDNDNNFSLIIAKFLRTSEEWSMCNLRINIVNNNNSAHNLVYYKAEEIINNLRINSEIRVVNNELENKPLKDLITSHSADSDLIILAIPNYKNHNIFEMMTNISKIEKTIIFVKSSLQFHTSNNIDILTQHQIPQNEEDIDTSTSDKISPIQPETADFYTSLQAKIQESVNNSILSRFDVISSFFKANIDYIQEIIDQRLINTKSSIEARNTDINIQRNIKQKINTFINEIIPEINHIIQNIGNEFVNDFDNICNDVPKHLTVFYDKNISSINKEDKPDIVAFKRKMQRYMKRNKTELYPYEAKIGNFVPAEISFLYNKILKEIFIKYKNYCLSFYFNLNDVINTIDDSFIVYEKTCESDNSAFNNTINNINNHIKSSYEKLNEENEKIRKAIKGIKSEHLNNIKEYLNILNFGSITAKEKSINITTSLKNINNNFETLEDILPALFNRILLNADLSIFKHKLYSYSNETIATINNFIINKTIAYHQQFITKIENSNSLDTMEANVDYDFKTEFFAHLNEIADKLTKSIQRFPNKIRIIDNQSLSYMESDNIEQVNPTFFSASRFLDYSIQYNYTNKIKKLQNQLNTAIDSSLDKQKDIITQLSFINNKNEEQTHALITIIENEINNLKKLNEDISAGIISESILTDEKLHIDIFIASSLTLKDIVNNAFDKDGTHIVTTQKRFTLFVRRMLTNIWYRQSAGMVTLQKIQDRNTDIESLKKYLETINKITLQPNIDQTLPYSYKQLFTISQQYNKDFWVGRKKEIDDFNILIKQYNSYKFGAILVTGGIGSGKTFFSYHVARMFYPSQQIFTIKSVTGGSASVSKFESSFLRSIDMQNTTIHKALREIPKGSIFILDNIEQWWHRSTNGNIVIDSILDLVNRYSNDYLFIINSNTESYNIIKLTSKIQQIFIGTINLLPFNAEELEKIILRRHKAGNMKIVLDNKNEKAIRPWNYAQLFSQYHKLTNGNIKSALNAWIASIEKIEDDTIFAHTPQRPESIPMHELTMQQIVLLVQFIIHNNMSIERIMAIWKQPKAELNRDLNVLLRLRLIERKNDNMLCINTILYPFILDELKKNEII